VPAEDVEDRHRFGLWTEYYELHAPRDGSLMSNAAWRARAREHFRSELERYWIEFDYETRRKHAHAQAVAGPEALGNAEKRKGKGQRSSDLLLTGSALGDLVLHFPLALRLPEVLRFLVRNAIQGVALPFEAIALALDTLPRPPRHGESHLTEAFEVYRRMHPVPFEEVTHPDRFARRPDIQRAVMEITGGDPQYGSKGFESSKENREAARLYKIVQRLSQADPPEIHAHGVVSRCRTHSGRLDRLYKVWTPEPQEDAVSFSSRRKPSGIPRLLMPLDLSPARSWTGAAFGVRRYALKVVAIEPGSAAEKAGLHDMDFVRELNGTPIKELGAAKALQMLHTLPARPVRLTCFSPFDDGELRSVLLQPAEPSQQSESRVGSKRGRSARPRSGHHGL
jgi:hypothetical protein